MAKYLTEFNTYADYQAASLSLPNVSLIKQTGEVYYKNIFAGATFGDVLMYDVANQKLVTTIGGNWDTTAWPIASYTPIAINVYPASQTPDGKARYLSLKSPSPTNSQGTQTRNTYAWGPNSSIVGGITSNSTTAFNGKENTMKAWNLMPGTTGNTQAEYAIFYACSVFAPTGTNAGDWYIPSFAELNYAKQHTSELRTIWMNLYNNGAGNYQYFGSLNIDTSTESSTTTVYKFLTSENGSWGDDARTNGYTEGCYAMIAL